MKKTFLLFSIFVSLLSATAQSPKYGSENQQFKATPATSYVTSTEATIENISVYPNPVVDELRITFRISHRSQVLFSIFNNIGKQVYTEENIVDPGNNIISIDIRSKSIDPGVYFVQLKSDNQTFTRKLIVK
jgi:hypothetical protein